MDVLHPYLNVFMTGSTLQELLNAGGLQAHTRTSARLHGPSGAGRNVRTLWKDEDAAHLSLGRSRAWFSSRVYLYAGTTSHGKMGSWSCGALKDGDRFTECKCSGMAEGSQRAQTVTRL